MPFDRGAFGFFGLLLGGFDLGSFCFFGLLFGFDVAERDFVAIPTVDAAVEIEVDAQALQPALVVDFPLVGLAVLVGVTLRARELAADVELHFFGLAAVTMRRVLVDHARRRQAQKRGSGEQPESLSVITEAGEAVDLLDLDVALDRFAERFPRQAKVVELRYFTGLEFEDVAQALDLSLRTVKRDWTFARAWLRDALGAPS